MRPPSAIYFVTPPPRSEMDMTMHDQTSRGCLNIEFMSGLYVRSLCPVLGRCGSGWTGGSVKPDAIDRIGHGSASRLLDAPRTHTRYDIVPWSWGSEHIAA